MSEAPSRDAGDEGVRFHSDGISISVSELFRRTGSSLEDDALEYSSKSEVPTRTRRLLGHGAPGIEIAAEAIPPPRVRDNDSESETTSYLVASALFEHPDGTMLDVRVYVDSRVVGSDLASCVALATRVFETVEPGPRHLDLSAGQRREPGFKKGEEIVFDIPAGFAVSAAPGSVRVHKIVPFGRFGQELDVSLGGGLDDQYLPQGPVPSYGESLEWSGPCEVNSMGGVGEGISIRAPRHDPQDVRQLNASASLFAPDVSSCEEMKRIARTFRVEPRGSR